MGDWKEEDKAPFQARWAKPDAATRTGCSSIASKKVDGEAGVERGTSIDDSNTSYSPSPQARLTPSSNSIDTAVFPVVQSVDLPVVHAHCVPCTPACAEVKRCCLAVKALSGIPDAPPAQCPHLMRRLCEGRRRGMASGVKGGLSQLRRII